MPVRQTPPPCDVEDWLAAANLPAEASIRRIREIILGADPHMTKSGKYRTLTFAYDPPVPARATVADRADKCG
jgi:hypothetical protein